MRASRVMAVASSCALVAGCSVLTTWDGLTSETGESPEGGLGGGSVVDGGADGPEDAHLDAVTDALPPHVDASACDPMGHYCGGDVVSGDSSTLYRCNASGPPTLLAHCVDGCLVRSGGVDVCRGIGGCVAGGFYCGGDKVTGDPTALYKCTSGSTGTLVAQCATTCVVNNGSDDACK